ncbi:MAG: TraR/DksA family transcriptional regulator [Pseudomonadales bacterium]|nr:TraR/DksA family transcriptional regulator [Pseudomonadales bacterium]
MKDLTSQQIAELTLELKVLRDELSQQLKRAEGSAATVTLDQTLVGRVSRMDAMQQQSVALSTRKLTELKLRKVTTALQAVAEGEYGLCRRCEEPIGYPRLQAQPEANLCINCQDCADNQ